MNYLRNFFKLQHIAEIITWVVLVLVLIFLRIFKGDVIDPGVIYIFLGFIIAFILIFYLFIYRVFSQSKRFLIKDIADLVLIGILIYLAKDLGTYFFSLYFFPIAAAAMTLNAINSLLIATVACIFVVTELLLGGGNVYSDSTDLFRSFFQVFSILLLTIFCRVLAMQLRSERAQKEAAKIEAQAFKEAEKREREFITIASHQLFTPLSIIRGFSSMIRRGDFGRLTPRQKSAIRDIHENTKKMVKLVSELLNISRLRAENFQLSTIPTSMEDLIVDIIDQLKSEAKKKNLYLKFEPSSLPVGPIVIDPEKIRQAIFNLIDNGIHYSEKGGVTVKLRKTHTNEVEVSVSDTGPGILPDDFEKLFQPFFRGKDILALDKKGTGLGLYICRNLVEKHQGRVWAESEVGKGSTFFVRLPIIE